MRKHPIEKLIEQGEGLHLDFKFGINDAAKIARSLTAFANTDGGKLLIGVKDNGNIKGVQSEEEYYMIDNAAQNYCKPIVFFTTKEWVIKGKKVLEINIPAGKEKPYRAPDKDGRLKAFFRCQDENLLATGVQLKVWIKYYSDISINISIEGNYQWVLEYLQEYSTITVSEFRRFAGVSKHIAENILSDFVVLNVLSMKVAKDDVTFSLE